MKVLDTNQNRLPGYAFLIDFVRLAVEHELVEELDFLVQYDKTKQAIQDIVEMPDRLDLFIQRCLQNHGCLSAKKGKRISDF